MDEQMQQAQAGEMRVMQRLGAFADARLSPDPAAVRRMRARVLREARARFEAGTIAAPADTDRVTSIADRRPTRRRLRRGAALLLAATLSLAAVGGAALAATPGGPLYGAALWLEEAMLPAGGAARTDAEIERLEHRLSEAGAAVASGNGGAIAAALAAYRETVDDALAAVGGNEAWQARLEAALGTHLVVLETLLGKVPAPAQGAIQQAITKGNEAQDRVDGSGGPGGPGTPTGPGEPKASDHPGQGTQKTPKPDATKAPKPATTVAPDSTPRPTPQGEPGQPASPGRANTQP